MKNRQTKRENEKKSEKNRKKRKKKKISFVNDIFVKQTLVSFPNLAFKIKTDSYAEKRERACDSHQQ